jgi:type II secretory pathway pseudopilin PulG
MLQEEKGSGQSNLMLMFGADRRYNSMVTAVNTATGSSNPVKDFIATLPFLIHPKTQILHSFTTYMDTVSAQARQPYAAKLPLPPLPSDPLNQMMLPVMMGGRIKDVDCQTQNGLLLLTLALHAYRLEHGRYPAALTELAPNYLKRLPDDPFAVQGTFQYLVKGTSYVSLTELAPVYLKKLPDDPFALTGTFKYRLDGKTYVLYSVGPDGKDDGGRPIDDPKHSEDPDSTNPNARYFVHQNSVGDVVAGKNTW